MVPFLRSSPPVQCSASSSWIPIHRAKRYNPIQQLGLYSLINLPLLSMKILQQSVKKLLWFAEADKLWTWSQSYVCFVFFFVHLFIYFTPQLPSHMVKKKKKRKTTNLPKSLIPAHWDITWSYFFQQYLREKLLLEIENLTQQQNVTTCSFVVVPLKEGSAVGMPKVLPRPQISPNQLPVTRVSVLWTSNAHHFHIWLHFICVSPFQLNYSNF